jgi:hypothetical protein
MLHWSPPWCAVEALQLIGVLGAHVAAGSWDRGGGLRALVSGRHVLVAITSSSSNYLLLLFGRSLEAGCVAG